MREVTEEMFLEDVSKHEMTVLLDNGVYRHLRFKQPNSGNMWFDIVTWPDFLAYSGDMGCFVFSRLKDMFEFFRTKPTNLSPDKLFINEGYWAEKLEAVDRDGRTPGAVQFSPEKFVEVVEDHFKEWIDDNEISEDNAEKLGEQLYGEVLSRTDDGEHEARQALNHFMGEVGDVKLTFTDTWEWDFDIYTFRFVWCCYALSWSIRMYDARKEVAV